jgi:photosystem II stability/assembly factor-like uncharacterized protein
MARRFERTAAAALLGALLSMGAPARATFTNQQINGDQNTHYLAAGAAGGTMACAGGFIQSGGNVSMLFSCTSDGVTWSAVSFGGLTTTMTFADASKGYLGTATGASYQSADGGFSWQKIPAASVASVADIATTTDGQTVFVLASGGAYAYSADGGVTWKKGKAAIPGGEVSAGSVDVVGQNVWIAGGDFGELPQDDGTGNVTPGRPPGSGFLMVSTDGGASFTSLATGLPYCVFDVNFVNSKEGWIAGGGATQGSAVVGWSTDGGATFTSITPPPLPDSERLMPKQTKGDLGSCKRIKFFGRNVGLALCSSGTLESDGYTGLYMTKDGGRTWEVQPGYREGFGKNKNNILIVGAKPNDMAMPDCKGGWIVGDGKLIQRWDADDQSIDCAAGGAEGDEPTGDGGVGDGGSGGGGGVDACGCEAPGRVIGSGSLLGLLGWLVGVLS